MHACSNLGVKSGVKINSDRRRKKPGVLLQAPLLARLLLSLPEKGVHTKPRLRMDPPAPVHAVKVHTFSGRWIPSKMLPMIPTMKCLVYIHTVL